MLNQVVLTVPPGRAYTGGYAQPQMARPMVIERVVTPGASRMQPTVASAYSTPSVPGVYSRATPVPAKAPQKAQFAPPPQSRSAIIGSNGFEPRAAKVLARSSSAGGTASSRAIGGPPVAPRGNNIQKLLDDRKQLKESVVKAFQGVAGSQKGVDINGLRQMVADISRELGIPQSVFGTIDDEYIRFDFEGTGFLEANEVYKLIKWHLYEHVREQDAAAGRNIIPTKTIRQAGYTIMDELGAGNQATLKVCCDKHGNQRCIKIFPKASLENMFSVQEMQEEFETMQRLACRNIARTFEMFQDSTSIYLVNEVYHGGDFRKLKERATAKIGALTDDWWKEVFCQCLEALVFMHQQAMMHCDVKEPNLMMRTQNFASPQAVLIDFGVSKAMTAKDTGMVSGTMGYMPPETMNMGKWYPGGDVFSLGVVMYQMMTGQIPDDDAARRGAPMIGLFVEGCTSVEGVKNSVNNRKPQFHKMECTQGLQKLCSRMLDKNMRSRPKAPACLKDPWFGGLVSASKNPEMMMAPEHPMATVGITDEMLKLKF